MAIFSMDIASNLNSADDIKKVKSYLYQLNEQLRYMFSNLDPDENYNDKAKLVYAETETKMAQLEVTVDGISGTVKDTKAGYESSIRVLANVLSLGTRTPEGSSEIELTGNSINLTTGHFTIDSKNLKIDAQGNGTFSGTLSANTLNAPTINGGSIVGGTITGEVAIECGDYFEARDLAQRGTYMITLGGYNFGYDTSTRGHSFAANDGSFIANKNGIIAVAADSETSAGWTIGAYLDWIYGEL